MRRAEPAGAAVVGLNERCAEGAADPSLADATSAERHWNGRPERVRVP